MWTTASSATRLTGRRTSSSATAAPPTCARSCRTTPTCSAASTPGCPTRPSTTGSSRSTGALSDTDIARFTVVDHRDRVALIATIGGEMIGVVRYERTGPDEAEVAFNIEDAHQGRGLGSVFLEHIAAAARERGISTVRRRRAADRTAAMLRVFSDAGYVVDQEFDDGVVRLSFDLEPTEDSLAVTYAREHRAEAASVQLLLQPETRRGRRRRAQRGLARARRAAAHRSTPGSPARSTSSTATPTRSRASPSYRSVRDVPGPVDLAVIAVPADEVEQVVADCAAKGVRGLVVMSERLRRDRRRGGASSSDGWWRWPGAAACGCSARRRSASSTPTPRCR